jgi:hypothetical protein
MQLENPKLLPDCGLEVTAKLPHNIRMLSKVCSAAVNGIEAFPIEVEVNAGWGDTKIILPVNICPMRELQCNLADFIGDLFN